MFKFEGTTLHCLTSSLMISNKWGVLSLKIIEKKNYHSDYFESKVVSRLALINVCYYT